MNNKKTVEDKRAEEMMAAINMYNTISSIEDDIAMGLIEPRDLDKDLMSKTKECCLNIIFS